MTSMVRNILPLCMASLFFGQAWATELSLETETTEASRGFGKIGHTTVAASGIKLDKITLDVRFEHKTQSATPIQASTSGVFVEGIFNYPISNDFYGVTRVGATDSKALFVDKSLYQEIGYKFGQLAPGVFLDLNGGLGRRTFATGSESFLNIGPSISTANASFAFRREQSLSSGGFRNVVAGAYWLTPNLKLNAMVMQEKRSKFTALIGAGVIAPEIDGQRLALGLQYKVTSNIGFIAKVEKVTLKRSGLIGNYYDPLSIGLGLSFGF